MVKLKAIVTTILFYLLCIQTFERRLFAKTDETTNSNFNDVMVEHTSLEFEIEPNKVKGIAHLKLKCKQDECDKVVLDIKDLEILDVYENHEDIDDNSFKLEFERFSTDFEHGEGLKITVGPRHMNEEIYLSVVFLHKNENTSIIYLNENQTQGNIFYYTNTKPISARSLFPCMDSPVIKSTYSAKITIDSRLRVVFSGIEKSRKTKNRKTKYYFTQHVPIPTYSVGFAIGKLDESCIEKICIYGEEGILNKVVELVKNIPVNNIHQEVEIIEKDVRGRERTLLDQIIKRTFHKRKNTISILDILKHVEEYLTKYEFLQMNIVVMPKGYNQQSENLANTIFIGQNVFDHDEEQLYVLVQEIVSNWIGNMISHSCWKHTSLSIGLAKYLERKVLEVLENREVYHITKNIGEIELFDFIDELGNDHHKTSLCRQQYAQPS